MLSPLLACRKAVVDAVASGALHAGLVKTFLLLSRSDQDGFLETFRRARLSFQTQREFLEWLTEIAFIQKTPVRKVLGHPEIRKLLRSRKLNWPQRVQKLRGILHTQRFPRLSAAEKTWKAVAKSANPNPSRVQFVPSPFFEKNRLEVRIVLTEGLSAKGLCGELAALPEATWRRLIYPLDYSAG